MAASAARLGPGSREGGAWAHDSQGLAYCGGRRRSFVLGWGPRREGHAAGQGVETPQPGAPFSRGRGLRASRLTAVFVRSASSLPLPQPRSLPRSGRPALAPRTLLRLVPRGCGCGAWVWALSGRRRSSGGAWAACDGELLLDAVLRAAPQGSGAAAAYRRRRRVSPLGDWPSRGDSCPASGGEALTLCPIC